MTKNQNSLSRESVEAIAELSRLYLTSAEIEKYQQELEKILKSFETLAQIPIPEELKGDARSALFLDNISGEDEQISRMRDDTPANSLDVQTFIAQAPSREGVFVRVPAILTGST